MEAHQTQLQDLLEAQTSTGDSVEVTLSYSIVRLLSEQLYQSPLKAIEELVVNAYDAHASNCHVFVPLANEGYVAIYDDGEGMDYAGLVNLWQIGHSNKRDEEIERRSQRKQIGKFGIGKLATYTIANELTYITKKDNRVLAVSIDFREFEERPNNVQLDSGQTEKAIMVFNQKSNGDSVDSHVNDTKQKTVSLEVRRIDNLEVFAESIQDVLNSLGIEKKVLLDAESWTLAILGSLKAKGRDIKHGRLEWVLRTAMPRSSEFKIYLNSGPLLSSKRDYKPVIEFPITELGEKRLVTLSDKTGEEWKVEGDKLASTKLFSQGVSGRIVVTERTLTGGKSSDLGRSYGFFVRVRDRLVNEDDPLFGLKAQVHDTFNRLDAQIRADDLDVVLIASRDSVEVARVTEVFQELLKQIFLEADSRYKAKLTETKGRKKEGVKDLVNPRLVEYPIADALLAQSYDRKGTEADDSWFYIEELGDETNLSQLVQSLYTEPRTKYRYQYTSGKSTDRLVKYDPVQSIFWLNENHEFVQEHMGNLYARQMLHDFVTAEMLLEVYLRENQVPPHLIGHILNQRDELLRSLAKDRSYSFRSIAQNLRNSRNDEQELEINLVVAIRALGFTANQISGSDEPDGIARYTDYPGGEKLLILEAKSSQEVPSLGAIDFGGLHSHKVTRKAHGCLLIAPAYPGQSNEDNQAALRAENLSISCWTVDQLARFVESAEARHLNASHVIRIVENKFKPADVAEAVDALLKEPLWDSQVLYRGIVQVLKDLDGALPDRARTIDMVESRVVGINGLNDVLGNDIEKAVREIASASQGGMSLDGRLIRIHVSVEELERRLTHLTAPKSTSPRRISSFRDE